MHTLYNSYRANVSAVILNKDNHILIGERKGELGQWQFPQGGIDIGERPEEAIIRELGEEIGTTDILLLAQSKEKHRYSWPPELQTVRGVIGQEQTFFLVRLLADDHILPLDYEEFSAFSWVSADDILHQVHPIRIPIYTKVLAEFAPLLEQETKRNFSDTTLRVFQAVQRIPRGMVATYGAIAKAVLGNVSPRRVGWILHTNPYEPTVPCHRVVFRDGSLAPNFGVGGWDEQERRLQEEGVIVDGKKVDLKKYQQTVNIL